MHTMTLKKIAAASVGFFTFFSLNSIANAQEFSGNLLGDPGFELNNSGFYVQTTADSATRITASPISGGGSLQTQLRVWGSNAWWSRPGSTLEVKSGTSFRVAGTFRGITTSTRSPYMLCADVLYVGANAMVEKCSTVSNVAGKVTSVQAILPLDPTKTIASLNIRITLQGPDSVVYVADNLSAELTYASTTVTPSPSPSPSASPRPSPTPSPSASPRPSASPSPSPSPSASPRPSPTPTPTPSATPTPVPSLAPITAGPISAIWANDGGDKVTQGELRGTAAAAAVVNRLWNGAKISTFGAKNEVVNFNLILEAASQQASGVSVSLTQLTGPGGALIRTIPTDKNGLFNWNNRNIELFYVKYLQIKGLSALSYDTYDERHVPKRMRRTWSGAGLGTGNWLSRPDHDKYYPDIAVPIEAVGAFSIAAQKNQSIWTDIYIPKTAPAGLYTGNVSIAVNGTVVRTIPVELTVRNFTLPDSANSKTMLYMGSTDVNERYLGNPWPNPGTTLSSTASQIRDRHFQLAHRHKISMIDANPGSDLWTADSPRPEWIPRLNGQLFTPANGYDGPGVGVGNDVFSIHTYGTWQGQWAPLNATSVQNHMNGWEQWFRNNSPNTERFLYLIDESTNYTQTEMWAGWAKNNPGIGKSLPTFATIPLPHALKDVPSLNIASSWFAVAPKAEYENANQTVLNSGGTKRFYSYNGKRPATGSFATEDDGVSLRVIPWTQYKKRISRWFFWESTYYKDFQSGRGQNNLFNDAQTFGGKTNVDSVIGETGWNHCNGDGVLFYPGTDTVFPADSLGVNGPIASLRLKHWRRGIQDVDYLTLARAINPTAVDAIVNQMVPKIMWENDVYTMTDPTWQRTDISWSTNPDDWESIRAQLAKIIEDGTP